jgi:hypothetical protein
MIGATSPQFPKYDIRYQGDNLHINKTYPTFGNRKRSLLTKLVELLNTPKNLALKVSQILE